MLHTKGKQNEAKSNQAGQMNKLPSEVAESPSLEVFKNQAR